MKRNVVIAATAVAALLASANSLAQSYPDRPVRIVTQFQAGSTGDVLARVMATSISPIVGQPVIVENRPGAGGVLAAEIVARAAPDGYTTLLATTGTQVMRVHLAKSTSFDPERDFTPITQVGESVTVIVAHPSLPANSMEELIEYAKRNPGKIDFGTSGIGSPHHLSAELIMMLTGVKMVHVPYKATSQALQDVISGQLRTSFAISGVVVPAMRAGKVKVLAAVRDQRSRFLPDVPAMGEIIKGFETPPSWSGYFAPAKMDPTLLRRIHADAVRALNSPETRGKLADGGFEVITNATAEDFAAQVKRQIALVGKIVQAANIKPNE